MLLSFSSATYMVITPPVTQPVEPITYRESLFDDVQLPTLITPKRLKAPPRKREKVPSPSLPMAYPPTIADLLGGLGETHAEAGALVGLSRSQTSNIIVGRFGVSRAVVQRVLELSRRRRRRGTGRARAFAGSRARSLWANSAGIASPCRTT